MVLETLVPLEESLESLSKPVVSISSQSSSLLQPVSTQSPPLLSLGEVTAEFISSSTTPTTSTTSAAAISSSTTSTTSTTTSTSRIIRQARNTKEPCQEDCQYCRTYINIGIKETYYTCYCSKCHVTFVRSEDDIKHNGRQPYNTNERCDKSCPCCEKYRKISGDCYCTDCHKKWDVKRSLCDRCTIS